MYKLKSGTIISEEDFEAMSKRMERNNAREEIEDLTRFAVHKNTSDDVTDAYMNVVENDVIINSRKKEIGEGIVKNDWINHLQTASGFKYFLGLYPDMEIRFFLKDYSIMNCMDWNYEDGGIVLGLRGSLLSHMSSYIFARLESGPLHIVDILNNIYHISDIHFSERNYCMDFILRLDVKNFKN